MEAGFVVLPDCAGAAAVARILLADGAQVLAHASGRPWLVGRRLPGTLTTVAVGRDRLALIGHCPLAAGEAERALAGAHDAAGLDALARRLPGSAHLVASFDGRVRVQGTLSGVRAVFHTGVHGTPVASDRPAILAGLTGADVDDEALALRLLTPFAPHPLGPRPVWRGVRQVPEDCWLLLAPDGTTRTVRWWHPPPAELTLHQGAPAVRTALREAVRTRVAATPDGLVSSDLSGGLDSGTLTCLAAADSRPGTLLTVCAPQLDPGGDDMAFARRLGDRLPGTTHLLLDHEHAPTMYAGLDHPGGFVLPDGPPSWVRAGAWFADITHHVAGRGSRLHLCGHGGDELFTPAPAHLHSLARAHPLVALRHARGHGALAHWRPRATARALADSRTFPAWLDHSARHLTAPAPPQFHPALGWTPPLRMPDWATPDAVHTVRAHTRRAAVERPAPLAPDRGTHSTLERVRQAGAAIRYAAALMAAHGVDFAAPYLDDRVIESALAVRPDHRGSPNRYKPLLAEAMRGLVPDELLVRATKGEYGEDAYTGLRRHRATLLGLFEHSALAGRGLVDDHRVRATLLGDHPTVRPLIALEPTLACELWLRDPTHPHRSPAAATRGTP
ncbi:asparagine synthase-related protein [Embleya hyalina]|uniref:asparagine synthase (glutamine-hydrolyzing) n=1 Tax=Embleya hyalina TaxID=516124 RepID=A0A401Z2J3_9ACTN|nr:asparagine synthase-related protein [Embleya hyalina]GCE01077.1 asparagine synthase [Embleya hyalina]